MAVNSQGEKRRKEGGREGDRVRCLEWFRRLVRSNGTPREEENRRDNYVNYRSIFNRRSGYKYGLSCVLLQSDTKDIPIENMFFSQTFYPRQSLIKIINFICVKHLPGFFYAILFRYTFFHFIRRCAIKF